jgi:Tfp pilus assembly protein PilO
VRARGKEVYIVTGVIILVVVVAWFFLLFNPLRSDVSDLDKRIEAANTMLAQGQQDVLRLKAYQATAPQTQADLLRLNKMLPSQTGIPSVIVELTQTAQDSGLTFVLISPGALASGTPFGVQPITIRVSGGYFDIQDFMFRLESYVEYRNNAFLVTGRLLAVSQVLISEDSTATILSADIILNAYLWQQGQPIVAPPAAPAPSASPSPSVSGSPSVSPSASPTASPTSSSTSSSTPSSASSSPSPATASPSPTGSSEP